MELTPTPSEVTWLMSVVWGWVCSSMWGGAGNMGAPLQHQ